DVANRVELIQTIQRYRPGDVVTLGLTREGKAMSLRATLGQNTMEDDDEPPMQKLLGGAVSGRASDFPAVFQHDTVIRPADCGGPWVALEGRVSGINIARAGRTKPSAPPADVVLPLIEPLKSGKLAPVNANAKSPGTRPGDRATTLPGAGE